MKNQHLSIMERTFNESLQPRVKILHGAEVQVTKV